MHANPITGIRWLEYPITDMSKHPQGVCVGHAFRVLQMRVFKEHDRYGQPVFEWVDVPVGPK